MNKIRLIDNKIEKSLENIKIEIEENNAFLDVKKIIITPLENSRLEIEYNESSFKGEIQINILEDITFDLFEINYGDNVKVKYDYQLDKNSTLNIVKFYDTKELKELDIVNLNGEGSKVNFTLKTIAQKNQICNLYLHHNAKNTISNVKNSGINIDGSITFNVEGIVPKGNRGCELNQNNRIINFSDHKCKIEPKLLIDENDVVANHAALIGKFSEDELFYLQSRGIDYKSAIILLVKGFLLEGLEDERLDKIIEKYWR